MPARILEFPRGRRDHGPRVQPRRPATLPVGPGRRSEECLWLIHRRSDAEWRAEQDRLRDLWLKRLEEEERQRGVAREK
jgi:hypothetical protein